MSEYDVDLNHVHADHGDANADRVDPREMIMNELAELDAHLRAKGYSLRSIVEHVAQTAFGVTIDIPHADTRVYLDSLADQAREAAQARENAAKGRAFPPQTALGAQQRMVR